MQKGEGDGDRIVIVEDGLVEAVEGPFIDRFDSAVRHQLQRAGERHIIVAAPLLGGAKFAQQGPVLGIQAIEGIVFIRLLLIATRSDEGRGFRHRDLVGEHRPQLDGSGPVAVTSRAASVGLEGMGGIGKTTLAADLCREPDVATAFPGGIFWMTLGETPDAGQAQRRLIHWVGGAPVTPRDTAEGRDRLTTLLAVHPARCLIVLDDLWEVVHAKELLPAVDRHTLLITTRRGDLLRILGAEEHRVGEMTPFAARTLLAACAGCDEDRLPAPADAIIWECGRLPLALAIVGALLAGKDASTWAEVLETLRRADHDGLDSELPNYARSRHVFGALAVSVDRLEDGDRERFTDLAVFPEDTAIPLPSSRICGPTCPS